jgi:hypothetical protein
MVGCQHFFEADFGPLCRPDLSVFICGRNRVFIGIFGVSWMVFCGQRVVKRMANAVLKTTPFLGFEGRQVGSVTQHQA